KQILKELKIPWGIVPVRVRFSSQAPNFTAKKINAKGFYRVVKTLFLWGLLPGKKALTRKG
ncbi:MAG: hypothetical protein ACQERN_02745, partial [Thermodesulfobacteriota bacterium]